MKLIKFIKFILLAGVLAAGNAYADDRFTINGYGFQDYRQTNNNSMGGATQRGTWDNNFFGLVMSAKITDRDTAWVQFQENQMDSIGTSRITWMFVDHIFSNNLSMHVGRVKFPFGIYTEFVDNKFMQLTAVTPSAYSSGADMLYDSYSGLGIDWTTGSLFTQVYGGDVYNPVAGNDLSNRRLIGGRITWNTPYEGLRFLVSFNETQVEANAVDPAYPSPVLTQLGREDRAMFSVDYVSDRFDIKAEYNYHKSPQTNVYTTPPLTPPTSVLNGVTKIANAWYIQGGYKMGLWTPYARFDSFQADQLNTSDPGNYQKDFVLGVNYKINDNINARIEDHVIHGYGLRDESPTQPTQKWNLMAAEVNFAF
jgi:hypothetical protein